MPTKRIDIAKPAETTEVIRKTLATDDIADTAPLAPKLPEDARILLMEARTALQAVIRRTGINPHGDLGKLSERIAKYLLENVRD